MAGLVCLTCALLHSLDSSRHCGCCVRQPDDDIIEPQPAVLVTSRLCLTLQRCRGRCKLSLEVHLPKSESSLASTLCRRYSKSAFFSAMIGPVGIAALFRCAASHGCSGCVA